MESYNRILELCIDDWWSNPNRLEIFNDSNVGIFRKVVKNSSSYFNRNYFLNSLGEEIPIVIQPQRIQVNTPLTLQDSQVNNNKTENTSESQIDCNKPLDLCESVSPIENIELSKAYVRNILFEKYRYRFFKKTDLFNLFQNLSPDKKIEFETIVCQMSEEKYFSEILFKGEVLCKLNYQSEKTDKYVKYQQVLNYITRIITKSESSKAPAHKIRSGICLNYRASAEELFIYLDDLVSDGILSKIVEGGNEYYLIIK